MNLHRVKEKIIKGKNIKKEIALQLVEEDLQELSACANEIRKHFCKDTFDLCSIVNGKSGRCSEDCKFCAQSSFYKTDTQVYPLLPVEEMMELGRYNREKKVKRYSIVTSGKALTEKELDYMCKASDKIIETCSVKMCASFGLLDEKGFRKIKKHGFFRIHNNLEASRNFFKNVCSTHSYDDKIDAIKAAQKAGLEVCSGGIMGLGESYEDRIDMALELRELGIKSVPINMLNPIPNTPFENNKRLEKEDMQRIVAIYRFILPDVYIRLAGGRGLLDDKGKSCFLSGANAAISGDMLTTAGITIEEDIAMLRSIGYKVD